MFCFVYLPPDFFSVPPSNVAMFKLWVTHSFMHQYRSVHNTTLLGERLKRCVAEENMSFWNLKPAAFCAKKQDFHARTYSSNYFFPGLYFVEHLQTVSSVLWSWVSKLHTAWKVSKYGGFSGPYFPVFGLNTEIYGVSQSKHRKIRTRKTPVFGHFSRSVH